MKLSNFHYFKVLEDYLDLFSKNQVLYGRLSKGYFIIDPLKSKLFDLKYKIYIKNSRNIKVKESDLKVDHMIPKIINKETFMSYFKGELTYEQLTGYNTPNNGYKYLDKELDLTLKDVYKYCLSINDKNSFDFDRYNDAVQLDSELLDIYEMPEIMYQTFDPNLLNEKHLIQLFIDFIHLSLGKNYLYDYDTVIDSLAKEVDYFDYITTERSQLVMSYFVEIHSQESNYYQFKEYPELLDTYKYYLNKLIEMDNVLAIRAKAYLDYEGAFFWPTNYKESESLLLKLVQNGDEDAINTLGYLYYYHNPYSSEPDYDKAYKYFSLGAIYNHAESKYKLFDMLFYGYGIEKNIKAAYRLIQPLYDEQKKLFLNGNHIWKFADVALRMAVIHNSGNFDNDIVAQRLALSELLEAKLAIKKRMNTIDYLGDEEVSNKIFSALTLYPEFKELAKTIKISDEFNLNEILSSIKMVKDKAYYSLKNYYFENEDDDYSELKITLNKNSDCNFLVVLSEYGKSYLTKEITIRGKIGSSYEFRGDAKKLLYDFYFDEEYRSLSIYDKYKKGDILNPELIIPEFVFNKGEKHQIASVLLTNQKLCDSMPYYFLADGLQINPNDRVYVESDEGPIEVTVYKVLSLYESELEYPIDKYRKVLYKHEESDVLVN